MIESGVLPLPNGRKHRYRVDLLLLFYFMKKNDIDDIAVEVDYAIAPKDVSRAKSRYMAARYQWGEVARDKKQSGDRAEMAARRYSAAYNKGLKKKRT